MLFEEHLLRIRRDKWNVVLKCRAHFWDVVKLYVYVYVPHVFHSWNAVFATMVLMLGKPLKIQDGTTMHSALCIVLHIWLSRDATLRRINGSGVVPQVGWRVAASFVPCSCLLRWTWLTDGRMRGREGHRMWLRLRENWKSKRFCLVNSG